MRCPKCGGKMKCYGSNCYCKSCGAVMPKKDARKQQDIAKQKQIEHREQRDKMKKEGGKRESNKGLLGIIKSKLFGGKNE